jgi:hypothetical protein
MTSIRTYLLIGAAAPALAWSAPAAAQQGVTARDAGNVAAQQEYFDRVEADFAAMEAARLRGDCDAFRRAAEATTYLIAAERPIGVVTSEQAEARHERLAELEARPCTPAGGSAQAADTGAAQSASLFDLGIYAGGAWSQDWFEPTGIGFQRDGQPGNAPETFAGETEEEVETSGAEFGGFFYIPGTDTMLRIGGHVRSGDARTQFDIPGNAWIDSGIVYGKLSPGGSSGIATPFGLTGWTEFEFDAWSISLTKSLVSSPRTSKTFDIPPPHTAGLDLSLYGTYGSWDRDYRAMADYSGTGGGYTFTFSQMRDQQVSDSFYELGFEGNLAVPVLSATVFHLNARAGGYYHDGDLDSFEHNQSNFGPAADRDFTIAIQESNNGWGFHGEASATLELVLSPTASLYFGAAADYRSRVAAIFNPDSGDQVFFDGLMTELRSADTHGRRIFAGARLRF